MEIYNLNYSNILHSETFWVAVAFIIFVILAYKKTKNILIETLDKRIEEIKKKINDTKKIKIEAETNLKEAKVNLEKIINNKKKIIDDAGNEADMIKDKILKEGELYSNRSKKKILDRIEQTKYQAVTDIRKLALEVSIKSVLDFLKNENNKNDTNDIAKSITSLFSKKNYKEL